MKTEDSRDYRRIRGSACKERKRGGKKRRKEGKRGEKRGKEEGKETIDIIEKRDAGE